MNEAAFSLTFTFLKSNDYRSFILRVPHLKSPHASFYGVLSGATRIYVHRSKLQREIKLTSNGFLLDILFDLRQWIQPHTIILNDFTIQGQSGFAVLEFKRCLHACVTAGAACFAHSADPETFHQLRLALRTFRSHLKIARKIGAVGLDELCARTKVLTQSSNELRDADVRIGLYEKFGEPVPATVVNEREKRLEEALFQLRNEAADIELRALRHLAAINISTECEEDFARYIARQTKKVAKCWRKLDLRDDAALHALRINMKMLSYGYIACASKDDEIVSRAKSIKAIQSRLGDVRDLRSFYRLPGLDMETRYHVVQKLSSLERELEAMEIR